MMFTIFWETKPELVPKGLPWFGPVPGLKPISEYATAGGLFIETVDAENEEALFKYVAQGIAACKSCVVQPVLPIDRYKKAML